MDCVMRLIYILVSVVPAFRSRLVVSAVVMWSRAPTLIQHLIPYVISPQTVCKRTNG